MQEPEKIRNIAIIAHIDHGKTTLLDTMLGQSKIFRDTEVVPQRVMDSHDQERERGITIFAKHTSVYYRDFKINIIDTPGHADFSGEVERVLGMVDTVLLLVDAQEGPMPQTRFVLSRALRKGIRPIVILNKIDRPNANPDGVLNKTFDLFVELGANDEQLDFKYIYASGFQGYAIKNLTDTPKDLTPLFDLIIEACPAPSGQLDQPFQLQVATIHYDDYLGRLACGKILNGQIKKGDPITRLDREGVSTNHKVTKIEGYLGLRRVEMEEAGCGDIVSIAGVPEVMIGDTLTHPEHAVALPPIEISEPTVSIEMSVNSSPFAGRDGKNVTMNKLRDRLNKERRANISLKIEEIPGRDDAIRVCGRGELHLSVLIESMRREDFEMTISKPQIVTKQINGVTHEPMERVHIEVPERFTGGVIEDLSRRRGEMRHLETSEQGITTLEFLMPTRGLMGYRSEFITKTSGLGILTSVYDSFVPMLGEIPGRTRGVLISNAPGQVAGYALFNLQDRGFLFVKPGDEVYEGMIVGEHSRDNDLVVNVIKGKQLTNVRASGSDENIILVPPRIFTLEQAIDYIDDDELIEVTPHFIRLRKKYLTENERKRVSRR
jgi:GTP-binding protein